MSRQGVMSRDPRPCPRNAQSTPNHGRYQCGMAGWASSIWPNTQQVIELPGVDGGLEQGQVGVTAGFDSRRQPQSDRGEITESPGTTLAEGGPAEGLQRLGKAAQVLAGFGVDPADEGVRRERKNQSPMARSRSVSLTPANSTPMPRLPGFGQGGTPAQVAGHLVTTPGTGAAARRWRHLI